MSLTLDAQPIPLLEDADGVVRVGATRVTLDTVVSAFHDGLSAEEISEQYPSLQLGVVYGVIAYYLSHRGEVDPYLADRKRQVDAVCTENETRFDPAGVRSRLLARRRDDG